MKKVVALALLISSLWLNEYKLDPWLIIDEVYDVEYNVC